MIGDGAAAPRQSLPEPPWRIAVLSAAILILELAYLSMLTGMRAVWLLVLAIDMLAWLAARHARAGAAADRVVAAA